jgi:hypothetical protein
LTCGSIAEAYMRRNALRLLRPTALQHWHFGWPR